LAGLSEGNHTVTIYGFDEFGNPGASEAVTFTVAKEAFPTTLVIAAIVVAAVVSFGLVAYLLRRKRRPDGA
jgi:mannitol-specific phosphotransferase system IIBC component